MAGGAARKGEQRRSGFVTARAGAGLPDGAHAVRAGPLGSLAFMANAGSDDADRVGFSSAALQHNTLHTVVRADVSHCTGTTDYSLLVTGTMQRPCSDSLDFHCFDCCWEQLSSACGADRQFRLFRSIHGLCSFERACIGDHEHIRHSFNYNMYPACVIVYSNI